MNETTIPYHLAIPSILCVVGLLTILIKRKKLFADRKRKIFWISVTVFLILYLFFVGSATYDDIYYQWDLNRYDLDKDGFFSGKEITKEQMAAEFKLTNDVGRNFSFVTGLIFSAIISSIVFIVGHAISLSVRVSPTENMQNMY